MLAYLGFGGIGLLIGIAVATVIGVLMALIIVVAFFTHGRRVKATSCADEQSDPRRVTKPLCEAGVPTLKLVSQLLVVAGVILIGVLFFQSFRHEEIGWCGALFVSAGIQLWLVGQKYLSGELGKRAVWTQGLSLLGSMIGVVLCLCFWVFGLVTGRWEEEFVFIGVFVAGTAIAVAIWLRFAIAFWSPIQGSWLTRSVAALLCQLGILELLVVGWCMFQ